MTECPECGRENEGAAVDCAHPGARLPAEGAGSAAAKGNPAAAPDPPGGDAAQEGDGPTADGARLFALLMRPSATAGEIAGMDQEEVARTVARRRKATGTGAIVPSLTDEEIAEAIHDYARTAPPGARADITRRDLYGDVVPRGLWVTWVVITAIGAGVGEALFMLIYSGLEPVWGLTRVTLLGWPLWALILGTAQWLVLRRWITRIRGWLLATVAAALLYAIAHAVTVDAVWSAMPELWAGIATGALLGAAIGLGQWLVLRRRFSSTGWWILACATGWALAGLAGQVSTCLGLLASLAPAALTGAVLVWLVGQTAGEEAGPAGEKARPPRPMAKPRPRSWWPLLPAGGLGAVTGSLWGVFLILAAVYSEMTRTPEGSTTGIGLLFIAGIVAGIAGAAAGAPAGLLLGAVGLYFGRRIDRKRSEAVGAIVGGVLGGLFVLAMQVLSLQAL